MDAMGIRAVVEDTRESGERVMVVRILDGALWNLNVSARRSQDYRLHRSPCQNFTTMDFGRERKVSDEERHEETDSMEPASPHRNAVGVVDGDSLAPARRPIT